jgi:YesN/AraC family two-component response regulator
MAVDEVFSDAGYKPSSVKLGEVEVEEELTGDQIRLIEGKLKRLGFEIIEDHTGKIIEKIKNLVIEHIHQSDGDLKYNFSELIESEIHMNYNYLSNLFSAAEGTTIEQYIIHQKIEKAKEYLAYNELTISEIAYKLGYSSPAYLSNQFKKVTGLNPSFFKKIGYSRLKSLDQVK